MIDILYVNHKHSKFCGVYDLGVRHYNILKKSEKLNILYLESNSQDEFLNTYNAINPKIVIFNYMDIVLPWVNYDLINKIKSSITIEIPHIYGEGNLNFSPLFEYHLLLDPTFNKNLHPKVLVTERPLLEFEDVDIKNDVLNIGSFGFAFHHKQFDLICKHINESFDECIFNLHMPEAYFSGVAEGYTYDILQRCKSQITKDGIILNHTDNYLEEDEIIKMLNKNDINVLFYHPSIQHGGISSSIDYMISAQKPILITDCDMFRHVKDRLPKYPFVTLTDIKNDYDKYRMEVKKIYNESIKLLLIQTENELEKIL